MLQIISKVSDATWLNLVKSAGSSVLWIDYVVDRCSKMRPFSEAGKVKSSTSLSQKWEMQRIFVNIVVLFTRSACRLFKIHRRQPSWISRVVRFSVNHGEKTRSQSYATVLPGTTRFQRIDPSTRRRYCERFHGKKDKTLIKRLLKKLRKWENWDYLKIVQFKTLACQSPPNFGECFLSGMLFFAFPQNWTRLGFAERRGEKNWPSAVAVLVMHFSYGTYQTV